MDYLIFAKHTGQDEYIQLAKDYFNLDYSQTTDVVEGALYQIILKA